jgi:hypothetical protein
MSLDYGGVLAYRGWIRSFVLIRRRDEKALESITSPLMSDHCFDDGEDLLLLMAR